MTETKIRVRWALLGVIAFALLIGLEVLTEDEPIAWPDLLGDALQTALIVATAVGVSMLTGRFQDEREQKETLTRDLKMARAESTAWRERAQGYLSGLGAEIQKQFEEWELTNAECEVGLLMLKGLLPSGDRRPARHDRGNGSPSSTRDPYQKSSLPGRSAFCAYFLEDLLPARDPGTAGLGATVAS